MSRRKGSNPRRRDEDFNRSSKLLSPRESNITSGDRQLFDPCSDNPIAFNRSATSLINKEKEEEEEPIRQSPLFRKEGTTNYIDAQRKPTSQRPLPSSGRRLWTADGNSTPSLSPTHKVKNVETTIKTQTTPEPPKTKLTKNRPKIDKKETKTVNVVKAPLTEEEKQREIQRKQLKSLIASLRSIEAKLETLTVTSRHLYCFNDETGKDSHQQPNRRTADRPIDTQDVLLVEQDIISAEKIWREKIELHLALGEKYLEILSCDLDYAEKKGLESLCWKRAVYSLVDQFRRALKKSIEKSSVAAIAAAATAETSTPPSALAALLMEETGEENITEIPVINDGNGMIFVKVEKPKESALAVDDKLLIKQTKMILTVFLEYLDLADNFYQKLTLFLKSVDDEEDNEIENYLSRWRRTRKYKWYSCIPLRGDIARYRWSHTPDDILDLNSLEYDNMDKPMTRWSKKNTFEEAWRRYFVGVWLMPAKGNLYFNLSLLLQQTKTTPGYEFHKLYFSTRSLMVRRNGFLNARESMLVLFESNRLWIHKNMDFGSSKQKRDMSRRQQKSKSITKLSLSNKDAIIPALFVRLHGMLFTKIGLDEFSKIKRQFFDILFEKNAQLNEKEEEPSSKDASIGDSDLKLLSESQLFWFETIILCLSSLYTYDYANSKLTKLLSINSSKMFYPDYNNEQQHQQYQTLLEDLGESILFTYEIDLTCQIAVELFQRYLDPILPSPTIPRLPKLPSVPLTFLDNKNFLFGSDNGGEGDNQEREPEAQTADTQAWLVYIEILLHWMVLNGICIRSETRNSLWESLIGDIGYDLISQLGKRSALSDNENHNRSCKISSAFWPLLLQFLNRLLSELPDENKYDVVNKHLLDVDDEDEHKSASDKFSESEYAFAKNISSILGQKPDLPEENYLRGLGWVDEIHGRFLKLEQEVKYTKSNNEKLDTVTRRKLKILDYGFTLVKHLDDILYYDPVEEIFTISKSVEERAHALEQEAFVNQSKDSATEDMYDEEQENILVVGTTIAEMDDDVLLSSETEYSDEKNEGDDIMTQLKKRREQLQSIVASAEQEERFGYRRLPARAKEREARLNYLRERVIPGKTILVLDTNCFIGHIDHVKKLFQAKKWSIIVPLVVVTELDGLRTNPQRLGLVAQQGIELLQSTLAAKPKQSTSLRIQTSHNNFMNDISIRSEQFVFGETDKNLDDLILSTCLWWISRQGPKDANDITVPVCLVTGDRNLSVKARARDVEVIPVSAIIQLTPKDW